uniref:Wnt inhibitory factor 1 n=1 Tax=Eptatretus burgeri TaxID=7764 RepID=A0A8C4QV12_EPTBU
MAPFTQDFRRAQQRMPAIPATIPAIDFTWEAARKGEFFYEFQLLRSLDEDIMGHPTINVPPLGSIPAERSVVRVSFPCRGSRDGVAAFRAIVHVIEQGGDVILATPENAVFFKVCKKAGCHRPCRHGGECTKHGVCDCPTGYSGTYCEKALCNTQCLNGGVCISPGVCICPQGYSGPYCDKVNCTCYNGGRCSLLGKCICPLSHTGEHCDQSLCQPECHNGGRCVGPGHCKCSKGYTGDLCSHPICTPRCGIHGVCIHPHVCHCDRGWHGQICDKYDHPNLLVPRAGHKNKPRALPTKVLQVEVTPEDSNYIW